MKINMALIATLRLMDTSPLVQLGIDDLVETSLFLLLGSC